MINKTDLHNLIHKYYLNGLVERVKWNIKNNVLEMDFMDDSAQVVGNLKAEDVEVKGAELKDGLLRVSLEKIVPDHRKARAINIK